MLKIVALLAGLVAAFAVFVRHMAHWGATEEERRRHLPGDNAIPGSSPTVTNAVTIDVSPQKVWPWIVQIGRGRAGFYTYAWFENLIGADIHNLDYIDENLQTLVAGDKIWLTPEKYLGRIPGQAWTVRTVDPGYSLVLEQSPPANPSAGTWSLVLEPLAGGRTRLLSRHCTRLPTGVIASMLTRFWSLSSLMERRMLLGVKERAER